MSANPRIEPYIFFGGRCEEALEFYRTALGAQIDMVMRYSDSPDPMPEGRLPEGFENKIMHASVTINGARIMASDGCEEDGTFHGFHLSLTYATEAEAQAAFAALAEGGSIHHPIGKTFWSPCFGMVQDKFGLGWMVTVDG